MSYELEYGTAYKTGSVAAYVIISIGLEEINQVLYRNGLRYIFIPIAMQQLFIFLMSFVFAAVSPKLKSDKGVSAVIKQFDVTKPTLKQFMLLSLSGFMWSLNVCIGRLVSFTVGSGPLDVMRSLIVPLSSLFVFLYFGKRQVKMCICGIAIMTCAFFIYVPNLTKTYTIQELGEDGVMVTKEVEGFAWSYFFGGVLIGIIAAHQTLVAQHFLRFVDGNAMRMMFIQTPWAMFFILVFAALNGEFDGYNRLLGVAYPSYMSLDPSVEVFNIMEKLASETPRFLCFFALAVVMGLASNMATMNLLQSVTVVTNNVTSQMKSFLGSAIGFFNLWRASGSIPTATQIGSALTKSVGGSIYSAGRIRETRRQRKAVENEEGEHMAEEYDLTLQELTKAQMTASAEDLLVGLDEDDDGVIATVQRRASSVLGTRRRSGLLPGSVVQATPNKIV